MPAQRIVVTEAITEAAIEVVEEAVGAIVKAKEKK